MEQIRYYGVLFSNEKLIFRQNGENEWERYVGEGEWEVVMGARARHEALGVNSDYLEIDESIAKQIIMSFDNDINAE